MKRIENRFWNYIEGINGLLFILYTVFILLTAVLISSNLSVYYGLISFFLIFVISVFVCPKIIRYLSKLSLNHIAENNQPKDSIIIRIALYAIPFALFLLYYIAYYPGGFSPDSISQYTQTINSQYNDWHPVIQTLFAFKLPLTITGGWIGSIALFQIICLSSVLGYTFTTILKHTNAKYTIASVVFVLANPQLGNIAMYPWKDISFAMGALLLLVFSLKIFLTKGEWIKKPLNTILFILTASLTTLFRHNALLFTIPLIIAILFYLSKKRGLIICLSIIVLCLGIKFPLYSAIGVQSPDKRQIETLGLPMTVIGAVVTYTPEALDEEIREFAYKVAPKEVWEEKYTYGSYNQVKWDDRTNNNVIEEYGSQRVISMMLKCFSLSKKVSLHSLIRLTEASYTISDEYNYIFRPGIASNEFDISQTGNDRVQAILNGYSKSVADNLPHLFMFLGVMHLLLIASILSKCKLNKLKDWKRIFFIIPVFAYNFGTTVLLTGIDDSPRFFFYTFMLIPVLLVFLFNQENTFANEGL